VADSSFKIVNFFWNRSVCFDSHFWK
jgi:hypothetical protein